MPVDYKFKRGVDLPGWQWLNQFPGGNSNHGTAQAYDGDRYIYWAIQYGSTATSASTSQLWRYDTWTNGWQYLATLTSGNYGMELEYDEVSGCIFIAIGVAGTAWQAFNPTRTAKVVANVTIQPFSLVTMAPVLPAAAGYGGSFTIPDNRSVPELIDTGIADATGNSVSSVQATPATATFGPGMVDLMLRVTSGAQAGQTRTISAVTDMYSLDLSAPLAAPLAAGDTFEVILPTGAATGGTTSTVGIGTGKRVNAYANSDVIFIGGALNGQRRRIASNTADTLTLAAAVTGNPRTGVLPSAPVAGQVFEIIPSSDFLYYMPGNSSTTLWRIDLRQTTGAAWVALTACPGTVGGGGNTFNPSSYAPFRLLTLRGNGTKDLYMYDRGTNTWSTITTFAGSETFNTGNSSTMIGGLREVFIQQNGSQRCYTLDLLTGELHSAGLMPYAAPSVYDGKRARYVRTPDGVRWVYVLRAGGQEFFRVPVEWMETV